MDSEPDYLDYYSDDPAVLEAKPRLRVTKYLKYLVLGSLVFMGTTYASNLTLNTNSQTEFGQGISLCCNT